MSTEGCPKFKLAANPIREEFGKLLLDCLLGFNSTKCGCCAIQSGTRTQKVVMCLGLGSVSHLGLASKPNFLQIGELKSGRMKYFVFVSDAKVDMLLPQIPRELKSKLAAEIGVNIGVLTASLKSERDIGEKADRISRLNTVIKFLRKTEDVGSIDEPRNWIEGTEDVRVAYPEEREAVFFVGRSQAQTLFALAGSSAHLTSRGASDTTNIGWSFLPSLLGQLRAMIDTFEDPSINDQSRDIVSRALAETTESEWLDLVQELEKVAPGPRMKVSFLAKRLLAAKHEYLGFNAVLATPLYVAMEE